MQDFICTIDKTAKSICDFLCILIIPQPPRKTDAFNIFIQQSLNVEGLPFLVTKNSTEALKEQARTVLMLDLKRSEERAAAEGWIDADDFEREPGVVD